MKIFPFLVWDCSEILFWVHQKISDFDVEPVIGSKNTTNKDIKYQY